MKSIMAGILCAACAIGCGADATDEEVGMTARFALELPGASGTIILKTVDFTLKRADGSQRTGHVDLSSSTRHEFVLGGLTPDTYTIEISATATDGATTCTGGSNSFAVTAG